MHRSTVHTYLNTLEYMGRIHNEHGLWYPRESSTEKPREKGYFDDFKFYIQHGLITKAEIDTYVAAKTYLKILPENSQERLVKFLLMHFEEKLRSLRKFGGGE